MSMKLLRARETATGYLLRVHLDTNRTIDDPAFVQPDPEQPVPAPQLPDPAWIREFSWGKDISLARMKAETKLLCAAELARLTGGEGTALAAEGGAL